MPNWNRILGLQAFKTQLAPFDYYRDLFLVWPFLGFSIVATSVLFHAQSPANRVYGLKLVACAVVSLLLAKERLILALAASAYVALHMAWGIIFTQTWEIFEWLVGSGSILVVILLVGFRTGVLRNWKPNYERPKKRRALDIAVGMLGLGLMIAIARWMKP
ncbi:MAG TPA: hypothetical protein VE263_09030 [Candidatus Angelobacter sp.]|nr:hypothetical protein [Candidatus Angelobacter sp.]